MSALESSAEYQRAAKSFKEYNSMIEEVPLHIANKKLHMKSHKKSVVNNHTVYKNNKKEIKAVTNEGFKTRSYCPLASHQK